MKQRSPRFAGAVFLALALVPGTALGEGPLWGVFHSVHSMVSDGCETLAERTLQLQESYDFAATVDHDSWIDDQEWSDILSEVSSACVPGFTYFAGYEWQETAAYDCEIMVVHPGLLPDIVRGDDPSHDTFAELAAWLSEQGAIGCIPHPLYGFPWGEPTIANEEIFPCVEVLNAGKYHWSSTWECAAESGCSSYGNPSPPDSPEWSSSVRDALDRGLRLGFVAAWDSHDKSEPPIAFTGLAAVSGWSREEILGAVRRRHTWAAEDRIVMAVSSGVHIMGDAFEAATGEVPVAWEVHAAGGAGIAWTNLFVDGRIVASRYHAGSAAVSESFTASLTTGDHYVFVEAVQDDLKRAWSSPMYITVSNHYPTLDPIDDRAISEDEVDVGRRTVALTGISDGDGGSQSLEVTAVSSDPSLIPDPAVTYASPDATGTLTLTPMENAHGTATITVAVDDGQGIYNSVVRTFHVTVTAANDAPVAVADSYTVGEGGTLSPAAPGVLGNDTDADLDTLTAVKVTDPARGALTLNADGSFTYVHDGSETSSDSFTYKANDGTADSNVATVTITVTAVNDAPEITSIDPVDVVEGQCIAFTVEASDPNGDRVTLSVEDLPARASFDADAGEFSWCPGYDQKGEYLVTFQASDGLVVASETVGITVASPIGPVFADNFADGAAPEDWRIAQGIWVASTGVFASRSLYANNLAQVVPLDTNERPLGAGIVQAGVKLTSAASRLGPNGMLVFAYQDPTRYRWVRITTSEVQIGQTGAFGGVTAGTKNRVRTRLPVRYFVPLTVKIHPDGWVLVYRGTATRPVARYRFLSGDLPSVVEGSVGLAASKARTIFDNVRVWEDSALEP